MDKDCDDDYGDAEDNEGDLLDQIRRIYGADVREPFKNYLADFVR